jgi:hypothetical protein
MRYVVDIPPEVADEINRAIKAGRYKSPQDFLVAAAQNQIYLETAEVQGDALHAQHTITVATPPRASDDKLYQAGIDFLKEKLLLPPQTDRINTVSLSDMKRPERLFGLANRLFPTKPVVRVLGNLLAESGSQYISLEDVQERSAEVARGLGKIIQKKDKAMHRKRGSIIYAGLPVGREDKSTSRFKFQFVGFLGKSRIEGAAPTLKFVDIVQGERSSPQIGLTDFGLKFSSIMNPIIDKQDYSSPFSEDEIIFLLDHIASQLPTEAKLFHLVLKSVNDGRATPDDINVKLESFRPKWTVKQVTGERVGLIGRMNELGLLEREKDGVKVTYVLSQRGKDYLAKLSVMGA